MISLRARRNRRAKPAAMGIGSGAVEFAEVHVGAAANCHTEHLSGKVDQLRRGRLTWRCRGRPPVKHDHPDPGRRRPVVRRGVPAAPCRARLHRMTTSRRHPARAAIRAARSSSACARWSNRRSTRRGSRPSPASHSRSGSGPSVSLRRRRTRPTPPPARPGRSHRDGGSSDLAGAGPPPLLYLRVVVDGAGEVRDAYAGWASVADREVRGPGQRS